MNLKLLSQNYSHYQWRNYSKSHNVLHLKRSSFKHQITHIKITENYDLYMILFPNEKPQHILINLM